MPICPPRQMGEDRDQQLNLFPFAAAVTWTHKLGRLFEALNETERRSKRSNGIVFCNALKRISLISSLSLLEFALFGSEKTCDIFAKRAKSDTNRHPPLPPSLFLRRPHGMPPAYCRQSNQSQMKRKSLLSFLSNVLFLLLVWGPFPACRSVCSLKSYFLLPIKSTFLLCPC